MRALIPRNHRRSAFPAFRDVRSMDRLFDGLWSGFEMLPAEPAMRAAFVPRVDVRETDEEVIVSAELPGLEEKDFDISVEEGVLTLKGEKRTEHEEKREGYRRVETRSGSFERKLLLPSEVDADAAKASFKNGVVTITLPKPPEARPEVRTIPVSTS